MIVEGVHIQRRKAIQYFYKFDGDGVDIVSTLHCLCDDGTVWCLQYVYGSGKHNDQQWVRLVLPEIPQYDLTKDEK